MADEKASSSNGQETGYAVAFDGGIAYITLNRVADRNRLTNPMIARLSADLAIHGADPAIKLICLRGAGGQFCGGRSPQDDGAQGLSPYEKRSKVQGVITRAYEAIRQCPVPVIAIVEGHATGFGAALAAAADITIAHSDAQFSLPEINQGFPPTLAMSAFVGRVHRKALVHYVLSADTFTAADAKANGLASEVIAGEDFEAAVQSYLARLATRPRTALEVVKCFADNSADMSRQAASDYATAMLALARTADDG